MFFKYTFLIGFLLFTSCATYIDVNVLKPASANVANIKNIAVLDFDFIGDWSFDEDKVLINY